MANEDLLLRQMPHSLEGEQAVLGSMLIDADCVKDVMDKLRPSDFYLRQNREIFETIYSMFTYAKPIDGITVCEEMQKAGTYDENTTRSYLAPHDAFGHRHKIRVPIEQLFQRGGAEGHFGGVVRPDPLKAAALP